jgi:16S rRNA G966 N2-methylase RsmD
LKVSISTHFFTYSPEKGTENKNLKMEKHRYNIYPEIRGDDYARLMNDLQANGYDSKYPIWIFENAILDGWNRQKICDELQIAPVYKNFNGTNIDAFNLVIRSNNRRNMTSQQWACQIIKNEEIVLALAAEAKEKMLSGKSDPAQKIEQGVNDKNARKTNSKLVKLAGGKTNRTYIAKAKRLQNEDLEMFENVAKGKLTFRDVKEIKNREYRKALSEKGKSIVSTIDFRLGDFETVLGNIPTSSIDAILTDPPFPYECIELWSKLSAFAKKVLKPDGFCITYAGQYFLPEIIERMSSNLTYYWCFCLHHLGDSLIVNGVNVMCLWKPILIFQNGKKRSKNLTIDLINDKKSKECHDWQQSISSAERLIEMFTEPGDLLAEPFAGSGSIIIACKNLGRNIIASEINEETYNIAKANIDNNINKL